MKYGRSLVTYRRKLRTRSLRSEKSCPGDSLQKLKTIDPTSRQRERERVPHQQIRKGTKIGCGSQMGAWHLDRLADWPSVVILLWLWLYLRIVSDKHRDLALQVGRFWNETVRCCHVFCGTWTRDWQKILRVNYKPVLSSERERQNKKPSNVRQ
jgi:hypothetical protein